MPLGFLDALDAFTDPLLLLAGIGVGVCSSVIPYVCDQLAMSRLPRASFALLLALLPATATIVGVVVLAQVPSVKDVLGVLLVMLGAAVHKPAPPAESRRHSGHFPALAAPCRLRRALWTERHANKHWDG